MKARTARPTVAARNLALACAGILACAATALTGSAATAAPAARQEILAKIERDAMVFFVAKGRANECGPGCSEWIVAEGSFDPAAEQRFRSFLGSLNGRNLPLYFNSRGGLLGRGVAIGRILRERRMTAGVATTVLDECRGKSAASCQHVTRSGRELKARLRAAEGRCSSACIYALIGAPVRRVPPGVRLGVHASNRSLAVAPAQPVPSIQEERAAKKRYTLAMGVDPGLVDLAESIPHHRLHVLSRREIVRFGIETRGPYETAWTSLADQFKRPILLKSVTRPVGDDGKNYQTASASFSCINGEIWFAYQRNLLPQGAEAVALFRAEAGKSHLFLRGAGVPDVHRASASSQFLQNAVIEPSLAVVEVAPSDGSERWLKLSTEGLSTVLDRLQTKCSKGYVVDED